MENYLDDSVEAVFITSPTYEGKCSDIAGIARICHEKNIPLIVDAAHGAHFGFGKEYDKEQEYSSVPQSAVKQGADIVIHSIHKTLPSMTQTALIHISDYKGLAEEVKKYLRIYQTSSPSYVLMASIDLCMEELEKNSDSFIKKLLDYRNAISVKTSGLHNIAIAGADIIDDPAKVVIFDRTGTMTGKQIYGILREEYSGTRQNVPVTSG